MSKLNEEESEKTIQGKKWKIIDWKNRPDTCTNGREGYFKINTIQTFPNMEEIENIGGDAYARKN